MAPLLIFENVFSMPCAARNNNHFEIISPDTQVHNRFYILGVRKVKKKTIVLKIDWCSLVPNNLLKSSLVP